MSTSHPITSLEKAKCLIYSRLNIIHFASRMKREVRKIHKLVSNHRLA